MDRLEMIWRLERTMRGILKAVDNNELRMFQEIQDLHMVLLALKLNGIYTQASTDQVDPA